ncbi:MAG: hypothetical protein MOP51_61 [Citricoccus sp.]|jgi:hypothetical protein|nr:hypothetical protein [Citricoccus sp. WCRC_4]
MYTHLFKTVHQAYFRDHIQAVPRDRLGSMDPSDVRALIRIVGEVVRTQMREHGPSTRRVRKVNAELERAESSLILIDGKVVGSLDQDVAEDYGRFTTQLMRELAPVLSGTGMHVISPEGEDVNDGTGWSHFLGIAAWRSVDDIRLAPFLDTETARCCHCRVPGDADAWASPVHVANEVTADLAAVLRQMWEEEQHLAAQPQRPQKPQEPVPVPVPAAEAPRGPLNSATEPLQYVNAAMIAAALNVSRAGVRYLSGFPDPAVTLAGPRVSQQGWDRAAVERWSEAHGRTVHWPDAPEETPAEMQPALWTF